MAVFEPRTNTSRRSIFQAEYPDAFAAADEVFVREAPGLEKIPPGERFSSGRLVEDIRARGRAAHFFADTDGLLAELLRSLRPGDLAAILSNGGFDGLHRRLIQSLAPKPNAKS